MFEYADKTGHGDMDGVTKSNSSESFYSWREDLNKCTQYIMFIVHSTDAKSEYRITKIFAIRFVLFLLKSLSMMVKSIESRIRTLWLHWNRFF